MELLAFVLLLGKQQQPTQELRTRMREKTEKLNIHWICGTKFMLCKKENGRDVAFMRNPELFTSSMSHNGNLWKPSDLLFLLMFIANFCFRQFLLVLFFFSFFSSPLTMTAHDLIRSFAYDFWFYIHFEWEPCRNHWNGIIWPVLRSNHPANKVK